MLYSFYKVLLALIVPFGGDAGGGNGVGPPDDEEKP